ncbi:MAG: M23 family metallopeptidase [Syntrophomonadaceae bacterium]|nr:M23 family metallopeptidase [Syntrophomonadaceae bacterium]
MKRKKKHNQQMTFMLIPHSAARPLRWNISRKWISGATVVAALLIICFGTIAIWFYISQDDIRHVNQIKRDNRDKTETIELLNQEIDKIEKQQDEIAQKQMQLKRIMGIKSENDRPVEVSRGGKGGIDYRTRDRGDNEVLQQTVEIRTQLAIQEKELDELLARVNNNKAYFRSIPNQWPVQGDISSEFGWRSSPFGGGGSSFHGGIDIANDSGVAVVAAADGTVVFAGWKGAYGKLLEINHGYGYKTAYGHNSTLLVNEGDKIKKGQEIARMGTTGRSTGPHLHFEVIKDGESQDPRIYLP